MHLSNDFMNIDANNDWNIDSQEIQAFEKKLNNPDIKEHHIQQIFSNQEMLTVISPLFSNTLSKIVSSYETNWTITESDILILQTYAVIYHWKSRQEVGMIDSDSWTNDNMWEYLIWLLEWPDIAVMKLRDDFNNKYSETAENIDGVEIKVLSQTLFDRYIRYLNWNNNAFKWVFKSDVEKKEFLEFIATDYWEYKFIQSFDYYWDKEFKDNLGIQTENMTETEKEWLGTLKEKYYKTMSEINELSQELSQELIDIEQDIKEKITWYPNVAPAYYMWAYNGRFERVEAEYQWKMIDKFKEFALDFWDYLIDLKDPQSYLKEWWIARFDVWQFQLALNFDVMADKIEPWDLSKEKLKSVLRENIDDIVRDTDWESFKDSISDAINYAKNNPWKASVDVLSIIWAWAVTILTVKWSWFVAILQAWTIFTLTHDAIKSWWYCLVNEYNWKDCSDWATEWVWYEDSMSLGQFWVKKWIDWWSNVALFWIFKWTDWLSDQIKPKLTQWAIQQWLSKQAIQGVQNIWSMSALEIVRKWWTKTAEVWWKIMLEALWFTWFQTVVGLYENILLEDMEHNYSDKEFDQVFDKYLDHHTDWGNLMSLYMYNTMFISAVRFGMFGGIKADKYFHIRENLILMWEKIRLHIENIKQKGFTIKQTIDPTWKPKLTMLDQNWQPADMKAREFQPLRETLDETVQVSKRFIRWMRDETGWTKKSDIKDSRLKEPNSWRWQKKWTDIRSDLPIEWGVTLEKLMSWFWFRERMENWLVKWFDTLLWKFANLRNISTIREESWIIIDAELNALIKYMDWLTWLSKFEQEMLAKFKNELPQTKKRLLNEFTEAIESRIKGKELGEKYWNIKFVTEKIDMFVKNMDKGLRDNVSSGKSTLTEKDSDR